jgi:hypothetical protein
MVQIQNESTISMWHDIWNGKVRVLESLELYSFTTKNNIIVSKAKSLEDFHEIFQLLFMRSFNNIIHS